MYRAYSIFPEFSLSIIRTGEIVTWGEVQCAVESLYHDPARRPWYRTLWDASRSRTLIMQPHDLHTSAQGEYDASHLHPDGDFAVVFSRHINLDLQVLFFLQRMAWFREVEIFTSVETALVALGRYGSAARH